MVLWKSYDLYFTDFDVVSCLLDTDKQDVVISQTKSTGKYIRCCVRFF